MAVKCSGCGADNTGWIPEDRLSKVVADRQAAQDALEAATAELGQLKEATTAAESKRAEAEATAATLQGERSSWATERQLLMAGVTDPEGLQIAQMLWDRMEPEQRPESISQWVTSETAPRAVRAYMAQPAAPSQPATEPAPAPTEPARPALPNGNAGIMPQTPQRATWDEAAIRQAGSNASEWGQHREAALADWKRTR